MHTMDDMMRAGCATRRAVRYWEDLGLLGLVQRTEGDTRRYTAEQVDKARIIAAAQFGGWLLDDIKKMLAEYDSSMTVFDALTTRLADQMRLAARLAEALPMPAAGKPTATEYDL